MLYAKGIKWVCTRRGDIIALFLLRGMMDVVCMYMRNRGNGNCRERRGAIERSCVHVL